MEQNNTSKGTSSGYFINQELIEEMVRLNRQGHFVTEAMGGVLPEQTDLFAVHDILDLACGPGEWALRVAQEYPDKHVVGVDLSERMIQYASVQAEASDINAHFQVMDITQPLAFPDASFDLVNMRMVMGFMKKESWPQLLAECLRVLRPGGIIRITEQEVVLTNSLVFDEYSNWWYRAFQQVGQSFALPGQHQLGITIALKPLLAKAGYVAQQHCAFAVDFSSGAVAQESIYENFLDALKLGKPFLIKLGIATPEHIQEQYERMKDLVRQGGFSGYWFFMTVWARKP